MGGRAVAAACHAEPHGAHQARRGMTAGSLLATWAWDPIPTVGVLLAALLYGLAWRRVPGGATRTWSRPACFGLGLLAVLVAVDGPPDALSESSFSAHMVQHLLLQLVAAPLLLLGGPVSLVLRADPPWCRRRIVVRVLRSTGLRVVTHPVTAFSLFAVVLVGSHLTPLYEIALGSERVHQLEHVAYLATALLFWWPALGIDPAPHRLTMPARLLYLFLAMPLSALLGASIALTDRVLYAHYVTDLPPWGASALADQHAAGTLLWISGMFTIVPAMAAVLWRWLEQEGAREQRRESLRAHRGRVIVPAEHGAGAR